MKKIMYVSISALCLAITLLIIFNIGAGKAQSQESPTIVGYATRENSSGNDYHFVILSNGDVYLKSTGLSTTDPFSATAPLYIGNFWNNNPPAVDESSWGSIKSQYKE